MLPGDGGPAYAPGGRLLRGGDRLHHPGLADALTIIAKEGPGTCYTGRIGESIVESVRADGGALGPLDLSAYRVAEREVTTAPLAGRLVHGRADLNRTVETLRGLPPELPALSHPERAVVLANALDVRGPDDRLGDTTNVTAVDPDGNACVITTTLGLGSGVWLPGLGVHLNSMLGEGELYSGDLPPGERLASMMCPLVVLGPGGALHLAVGSAGASRIRSALLNTLVGILVDGLPTPDAVRAPRLHPVDDVVHVEPHYPLPDEMARTEAGYTVNRWTTRSHYFGGVSAIGTAGASGDPRRGGTSRLL